MTNFRFNPKERIITCVAEIIGPKQNFSLKMIIDTGATYTMIPKFASQIIGLPQDGSYIEIVTGTKVEKTLFTNIPIFKALGFEYRNMPVLIHDLPSQINADGLLGLNFLKKAKTIIDFSKNQIVI